MIGDEGSGYWIGREALAAVMRASDGRGPADAADGDILRTSMSTTSRGCRESCTTASCRG